MASTVLTIFLFIVAAVVGIGVAMFLIPELLPFLDEQTRIIIAIVLTFFAFISFYFMTKSAGGGS